MLIKKNLAIAKTDDLIALRQQSQHWDSESSHHRLSNLPTNTLNPEFPLASVLVPQAKNSLPMVDIEKEDSQFSFKQKNLLNVELPLVFDEDILAAQQQINRQKSHQTTKIQSCPRRKKTQEGLEQEKSKLRNKATIGKLINHSKIMGITHTNTAEPSNNEETADNNIKKPTIMSISNCKFYDTLNKIKSLKLSPNHAEGKKQTLKVSEKQRYSMAAKEEPKVYESKIQSTDTSAEEGYPIRRQIIMSIKKNVDRASLSPNREHKRIIPHQSEESQTNSMLFYLNQTEAKSKRQPQEPLDAKSKSFIVRSANKRFKKTENQAEHVTISYKTSILELKQLSSRFDDSMKIRIKIAEIFSTPLFDQADDQEEMFSKAATILRELQVHSKQIMTIRKYCNCIIVLIENLAIISYFSGHVYFGGWQRGSKNGLGFQWSPSKFVYYGQYVNGKRQGYGVLKDRKGEVLLGQWKANNYISLH